MPSLTWRRSGAEVSFLRRDRPLEIPDEVGRDVVADGRVGEVGVQEAPPPPGARRAVRQSSSVDGLAVSVEALGLRSSR